MVRCHLRRCAYPRSPHEGHVLDICEPGGAPGGADHITEIKVCTPLAASVSAGQGSAVNGGTPTSVGHLHAFGNTEESSALLISDVESAATPHSLRLIMIPDAGGCEPGADATMMPLSVSVAPCASPFTSRSAEASRLPPPPVSTALPVWHEPEMTAPATPRGAASRTYATTHSASPSLLSRPILLHCSIARAVSSPLYSACELRAPTHPHAYYTLISLVRYSRMHPLRNSRVKKPRRGFCPQPLRNHGEHCALGFQTPRACAGLWAVPRARSR